MPERSLGTGSLSPCRYGHCCRRRVSRTVRTGTLRTDSQVCVLFRNPCSSERMNLLGLGGRSGQNQVQASESQEHSLAEAALPGSNQLSAFTTQLLCLLSPQRAVRLVQQPSWERGSAQAAHSWSRRLSNMSLLEVPPFTP